ncbi:proline--tRNA ligase [cyanobiont of Ornithocercus magnificus]|nr:proline--tRNA ligase [cyanobiont of Ornithocercus magnificus]
MRASRLMLVTLRNVPAEAEIISHQLLVRGGFIRRISGGIHAYLPLMWRVLRRITSIIRDELNTAGALETLLPQLQPADLWRQSQRWQPYTAGEGIMFHLQDRQGRDLGLGPTHEEVVTSLAGELLFSYRQLPVTLYQIQTKFRDEMRPRFGLMRSREFIMKDAYSFHATKSDLCQTYEAMSCTYKRIFERCGLKSVTVEADSGAIGGAASQEFMVTANSGEDVVLTSSDGCYAANQEKAVSLPDDSIPLFVESPVTINTSGCQSIEDLCKAHGFEAGQLVKVLFLLARLYDGSQQPVLVSLRGDQELNKVKLLNALQLSCGTSVLDIIYPTREYLSSNGLESLSTCFLAPDLPDTLLEVVSGWVPRFLRLADMTASSLTCFVCSASTSGFHRVGVSWEELGGVQDAFDLRMAREGERCCHNPSQRLKAYRGIEVGHIFQLGQKYSSALEATFTTKLGRQEPYWMGCYGIGVSRLAQSAVEQHHDEDGIIWPIAIAPFEVLIVIASIQDELQRSLAERLYNQLCSADVDTLLDDRSERAGVKLKDADLIGIPWRLVVGRDAAKGYVELVRRASRDSLLIPEREAVHKLCDALRRQTRTSLSPL